MIFHDFPKIALTMSENDWNSCPIKLPRIENELPHVEGSPQIVKGCHGMPHVEG